MKRVLLLAALTFGTAGAMERTLTPSDVTVLQDGRGQSRLVFRLPDIAPGERIAVSSAQVVVSLAGAPAERRLRLRVHPLTRDWSGGSATWTSPWSRPGGDIDEDAYIAADVDLRSGVAVLDVTPLVKEVVEEGWPAHGFLLTRDPADGVGVPAEDASRFGALSGATVSVRYVRVGPRPREGG
jgi:hypothetical protein